MFKFDRPTLVENSAPAKLRHLKGSPIVKQDRDPLEVRSMSSSEPRVIRPAHFADQIPVEGIVTEAEAEA